MDIQEVRRILIIGAGTMGQEIGLQCAAHGYDVVIHDIAAGALEAAKGRIAAWLAQLVDAKRLRQEDAEAATGRMTFTPRAEDAAGGVDLVSESVPEDLRLKCEVFAQFNRLCPPRAVFTTNTSMLRPSMMAEATGRPSQFAALHFHPHVWESNVADIMPHPGTAPATVSLLREFAVRIGQIPMVLRKENPGYVFNAILGAINRESLTLAANGVASVEDIDRAWMGVMKTQVGPFGMMDRVGLDTVWQITDNWARRLPGREQLRRNADFLRGLVEEGRLGVKTGRGFYTYPGPAFERQGFVEGK